MRQYLIYSSSLHFSLILVLLFVARDQISTKKAVYYIDFIGPSKIINTRQAITRKPAVKKVSKTSIKKPKEAKPPIRKKAVEADIQPKETDIPLPKPSMLQNTESLFSEDMKEREDLKQVPAAENGELEQSGITANFSDFPYPWYISLIRNALSNEWMTKMPSSGTMQAVIRFDIMRDGSLKKLKVDKSSGNRLFDNAAMNSVKSSAPFEALPDNFHEKKLSVHVEFKTME